jgi:ABC-type transport system involved in cytochrome bd biosynthesis fused ATPase/permease subunit
VGWQPIAVIAAIIAAAVLLGRCQSQQQKAAVGQGRAEAVAEINTAALEALQGQQEQLVTRMERALATAAQVTQEAQDARAKMEQTLARVDVRAVPPWPAIVACMLNQSHDLEAGRSVRDCGPSPAAVPDSAGPGPDPALDAGSPGALADGQGGGQPAGEIGPLY